MSLANSIHSQATKDQNVTQTSNGAKTFRSTLNSNLDFYSRSGQVENPHVLRDFDSAYAEDQDMAIRNILKMRDVRGGHGVRENFRKVLKHLAENHLDIILNTDLLEKSVEVGRWDDVLTLTKLNMNSVNNLLVKLVAKNLNLNNENSLVAKWLPINSRNSFDQAFLSHLRSYMKLTPKELRSLVVKQRKNLVEVKMSSGKFKDINYPHVPSRAMHIYRKAFKKHDPEGFANFVTKAVKGEVKVNAAVLYPHEVLRNISLGHQDPLANAQWANLKDYIKGESKILPMVDVSASMECRAYSCFSCMNISVALGLYISERSKSDFKDLCMTFHSQPSFVSLKGSKTLEDRYRMLLNASWGGSTNLEGAFNLLLDYATKKKAKPEDMPEYIMVLTDMQYNPMKNGNKGAMGNLKKSFKKAGYEMPKIIWWNLHSNDNTPVRFDSEGTAIVSGASPALLEAVLADDLETFTPLSVMTKDLMQDRYTVVFKS